jgi:hypothetical protein
LHCRLLHSFRFPAGIARAAASVMMMVPVVRRLVRRSVIARHRRIRVLQEPRQSAKEAPQNPPTTHPCLSIRRDRFHFALELRRTPLEDLKVFVCQLLENLRRHVLVDVAVPNLSLARIGDLNDKWEFREPDRGESGVDSNLPPIVTTCRRCRCRRQPPPLDGT